MTATRGPSCTGSDTTCRNAVRHAATQYVLHHRATKLHHRATKNTNCNIENVPQHTILQRACRDLSMYPMAKEYTLMQPFKNVMCRCNPLQHMACKRACRHIVVPHRLPWQHSSVWNVLCYQRSNKEKLLQRSISQCACCANIVT